MPQEITIEYLTDLFDEQKQLLEQTLPTPESVTVEESKELIATYTAAIMPNFIPWMQNAQYKAKTCAAKCVIDENLREEAGENHPGMLLQFAASAGALPEPRHWKKTSEPVSQIWTFVQNGNSLENVALMAAFENTSEAFIPLLEGYAINTGSNNLEYTQTHGVADKEHSQELLFGTVGENHKYTLPEKHIRRAVEQSYTFFSDILAI